MKVADPAASRRLSRRAQLGDEIPGITVLVIEYSEASEDGSEISETFTRDTDLQISDADPGARGRPPSLRLAAGNLPMSGLARLAEASGDRRGRLAQPRLGARQLVLGAVLP